MFTLMKNNNLIESKSLKMDLCVWFHDYLKCLGFFILFLITFFCIKFNMNNKFNTFYKEKMKLEMMWTLMPGVLMVLIFCQSISDLYSSDLKSKVKFNLYKVKIEGHQWFWSYSGVLSFFFSLDKKSKFNFMKFLNNYFKIKKYNMKMKFLKKSFLYKSLFNLSKNKYQGYRLLEVSNPIFMKMNNFSRFLVSSNDVMHSFSVEALGLKMDAIPGRVNLKYIYPFFTGSFYGQCSELCGENHSFMPMNIEILNE